MQIRDTLFHRFLVKLTEGSRSFHDVSQGVLLKLVSARRTSMAKIVSKLNPQWITQTRTDFLQFLQATQFPHPVRNGQRGSAFDYPEWLIMLIAVLAVKC